VTTVSSGRTRQRGSILVHETGDLSTQDRTVLDDIPVTSLARTLVDLAAVVDATRLGRAFEEAERIQMLDVRAVEEVLRRSNGRKGTKRVRALLAERRTATDTREGLERDFADVIRQAGLPIPAYNALIEGFLVDAVWMDRKLIVEIDGYSFHDRTRRSFEEERVRHTHLQLKGWTVIRLTEGQMPDAASVISALL
jgi:very-short-patch-repair endonuclease